MKKAAFILALLAISISSVSLAGYGENRFKKKIEKHILYPETKTKLHTASVKVQFSVNEAGEIVIDQIDSSDQELIEYVSKKLKSIKVEQGSEVIGKTYSYHFTFEDQQ